MMLVPFIENILFALTLGSQLLIALVIILFIGKITGSKAFSRWHSSVWQFLQRRGTLLAFIVVLAAMSGSLFFEEIAGYEPCELCWWQRIFMYPQVFLFGLALIRKKRDIFPYAVLLSIVGGCISAYHYSLQILKLAQPGFSDTCSATGTSCATTEVFGYGYITIPLMALTAFALVLLLFFAYRTKQKEASK